MVSATPVRRPGVHLSLCPGLSSDRERGVGIRPVREVVTSHAEVAEEGHGPPIAPIPSRAIGKASRVPAAELRGFTFVGADRGSSDVPGEEVDDFVYGLDA